MIGRFLIGMILMGFLSCGSKASLPDSVLPAEKMEPLLWDLLRAEQFVTNYVVSKDTSMDARAKGPILYAAILKKHGTTDSVFRISLAYYKKHPTLLFPLLDSIGTRPDLAPTTPAIMKPVEPSDTTQRRADSAAPPSPSSGKPSFQNKPVAY